MSKKRKSPIKHKVQTHKRDGKVVHSYIRGRGLKKLKLAIPTIEYSKPKYVLATGKEQDAFVLGYKPRSEKLVWMSPRMFLSLSTPAYYDQPTLENLQKKIKNKEPLDALWFDVDVNTRKVQRHEGRHRAKAAQKLGIEKVPVILYAKDRYEWEDAKKLPDVNNLIRQRRY